MGAWFDCAGRGSAWSPPGRWAPRCRDEDGREENESFRRISEPNRRVDPRRDRRSASHAAPGSTSGKRTRPPDLLRVGPARKCRNSARRRPRTRPIAIDSAESHSLKKSLKLALLPFDRSEPPAYIPRPRRPPGQALRAVLHLWHDGNSRLR
jgi:hypothetical protein